MPSNKNALIRYKYLDELLSNRHHFYNIHDLTELVNKKLTNSCLPTVTQRCIEKDINALEDLFHAYIKRERRYGQTWICYENTSFSIFTKEMSDEERLLLREVLNTLGQFEGLNHFTWFYNLKSILKYTPKEERTIINFGTNQYLRNSNLLGKLFDIISNRQVIRIGYKKFNDTTMHEVVVYPYQLKQYNDRWHLLCSPEDNTEIILNFALDRIVSVVPLPEREYIDCNIDLEEHFEDVVGITLYANRPLLKIILWASEEEYSYIETKPIHPSQKPISDNIKDELRKKFEFLKGGEFFEIDCIENYELIRELSSFGNGLLVLSPKNIQDKVLNRISCMMNSYKKLRQDSTYI